DGYKIRKMLGRDSEGFVAAAFARGEKDYPGNPEHKKQLIAFNRDFEIAKGEIDLPDRMRPACFYRIALAIEARHFSNDLSDAWAKVNDLRGRHFELRSVREDAKKHFLQYLNSGLATEKIHQRYFHAHWVVGWPGDRVDAEYALAQLCCDI